MKIFHRLTAAVLAAVLAMTQAVLDRWGPLPVLCAGGVASNGKFHRVMGAQFGARFAPPAFSSDNAAGIALLAAVSAGESVR